MSNDLQEVLGGSLSALDAYLEVRDAREIRDDILALVSPQETLRDKFAAKAMHAELMTCGVPGKACNALIAAAANAGRKVEEQIAFNAYEMADAMLRAREAQP
jgi:hypothetical protein